MMSVLFFALFCIGRVRPKEKLPDDRFEVSIFQTAAMPAVWKILFSSPSERQLKKNQELAEIPKLGKEWLVSFEVKPTRYRSFGLAFQMSTGGKVGQYGDRTPAIWLHKTRGVFVSSAVNGDGNFGRYLLPPLEAGNWTKIEVGQKLQNASYVYSISIDGAERFSVENKQPEAFENVKVWAGDPWVDTQKGAIRNLTVQGTVDEATTTNDTAFASKTKIY